MYIEMENIIRNLTKANTLCTHQHEFKHSYVLHGMSFLFLSERNPLGTHSNLTSKRLFPTKRIAMFPDPTSAILYCLLSD